MKKIFILALNIALVGSMCSCSDFLDREPKNTVDPETTVDEDVAVSMANACYRTLQSSNMYNQRLWTLDIVAGNSIVGAGGGTDGIETVQASNFTTQSDNGMALYMWRSPWVGIGQCNILINALEDKSPEKGTILGRSLGEAYFLRAHYYYILVIVCTGTDNVCVIMDDWHCTDDCCSIFKLCKFLCNSYCSCCKIREFKHSH